MILTKVTIHKYKNFTTEQDCEICEHVTRIVGKNESGKTAFLEALAKSNYFENNDDYKFNKGLDYPRSELVKIKEDNPPAITCQYQLSTKEQKEIENHFLEGILKNNSFSSTSLYNNEKQISNISVDFSVFKTWLISKVKIAEEAKELLQEAPNFSELLSVISKNTSIPGITELQQTLTEFNSYQNKWEDPIAGYIYDKYLSKSIPKFWYFSDYYSLPHKVNLNDLVQANTSDYLSAEEIKITNALLTLSGLKVSDIQSENDFENFKAQLEATSNYITDEMFKYWTSNQNLEIQFDIEHHSSNKRFLNIRIRNTKQRITLPLKNRSKGFLWFFSFFVWFSKIRDDSDCNYILLLDEPGLSLHASAQKDLLRFIDVELSTKYQVLYTTHSPFMIDSLKLNEVRTVYDQSDSKHGSIISDALEEKDSDTLFPLQAALGYSIAQNLYISPKNLLVEGISDLIYLNYFSNELKNAGREGLSEDITIVPVGGADKIATFISLMRGNQLSVVCLLDTFREQGPKARLRNLIQGKIIKDSNILYYNLVTGKDYADIEDLFRKEEYLSLYNRATGSDINLTELKDDETILDQLKHLNNGKSFNHYLPASYLIKNTSKVNFSDETYSCFEKLFQEINLIFKK